MKFTRGAIVWGVVFLTVLCWSVINPKEYFTWIMEVFPALIGAGVLLLTYKRFKFTTLAYCLILIHATILFVGGHYTYSEVPLFNWIRDTFHQARNNYDKVGHFAQGFVPAIIARELFIRLDIVQKQWWRVFLVISVCLSISAVYELVEWLTAALSGSGADAFLGTQGYVWDTQSDMLFALIGAVSALLFLSQVHNKQLQRFLLEK